MKLSLPKKLADGVYTTCRPLTAAVPCAGACATAMLVIGPASLAVTAMVTGELAGVVAVSFTVEGGNWKDGRIALGGVSPVPYRAKVVEDSAGTPLFLEYKGRKVADV